MRQTSISNMQKFLVEKQSFLQRTILSKEVFFFYSDVYIDNSSDLDIW